MPPTDKIASYHRYLKDRGLRSTRQRDLIVGEFFRRHQHLTVEELLEQVRRADTSIGFATVYRTLKLLTDSGLAWRREFGGGRSRYEHITEHHHDHLICTDCGRIMEFENDQIEALQARVCRKHRFRMTHHKMELYGLCEACCRRDERRSRG